MARNFIQAALGATGPVGGEQITLFIPSKNRAGEAIDQERWADEALDLLGRLFRGATAFPPGKGVWRDDAKGGELLREITVMVVSHAPRTLLSDGLGTLREFLHRFGREAGQGEVGVVIDGRYFGVSAYDES
ncbi:MAG: hypothetical protein NTY77_00550 [Elusimicrobia bacterium]|nr:hypothetical protein [Elusimicrobiota bacterium]